MDEKYIIDRVEGDYAIVEKENGDMHKISICSIKGSFKEGDILINRNEYFEVDETFTLIRKKQIDESMKDMWEEWSNLWILLITKKIKLKLREGD